MSDWGRAGWLRGGGVQGSRREWGRGDEIGLGEWGGDAGKWGDMGEGEGQTGGMGIGAERKRERRGDVKVAVEHTLGTVSVLQVSSLPLPLFSPSPSLLSLSLSSLLPPLFCRHHEDDHRMLT